MKKSFALCMVLLMIVAGLSGCSKNIDKVQGTDPGKDPGSVSAEKSEEKEATSAPSAEPTEGAADAQAEEAAAQAEEAAAPTEEPTPEPTPEPKTMYVSARDVNFRAAGDKEAEILDKLSKYKEVTAFETQNGWTRIEVDGVEGYISNDFLTDEVPTTNGRLICIDAGHQIKGNYDKEPIGPGATELKTKVSSGTQGVVTGVNEYVLNLEVAMKLKDELELRGYEVIMCRESHEVDISNVERAQVANDAGADAFIRVHANSAESQSTNGILTICQTPSNIYNGYLYDECKALSTYVLDEMVAATGAKKLYVWETDTMIGINWAKVPVTIVEMGFMSNPDEDKKMATEEYRRLLAEGIAEGTEAFFKLR